MSAAAYFWCACAFMGAAAALTGLALALAPAFPASRLGLRGLKRQRALQKSALWQQLEPLVRWLGVRLRGVLPPATRESLDRQISLAGDVRGLTAEECVALMVLSTLGGAGFAVYLSHSADVSIDFALAVLVPLAALLPYLQLGTLAKERLVTIRRGLPFVIDLMAMAMSAGLDFPAAVRQVVEKAPRPDDPIIEEMSLMLQSLQIGHSRRAVLEEFARRAPCDAVLEFTGAVIQAEERGNPIGDALQVQAATYRSRRSVTAEEAAAKAGVKMTAPLLLVFVSVMLLVLGPLLVGLEGMN